MVLKDLKEHTLGKMREHHVIETDVDLQELDNYLSSDDSPLALDTETDGLHFFCKDIGVCVSVDSEVGFYIPTRVWNGKELVETPLRSKLLPYFKKWFIKSKRHLIFHNAIFDCRVMKNNYGLHLIPEVLADTRLLYKMTVSEDGPSDLKGLAVKFLTEDAKDEQTDLKDSVTKNGGKWLKDHKEFYKADMPVLAKYGAMDPCLTLGLYNLFSPKLINDKDLYKLWNEETLPLMEVVYEMNTTGFKVDIPYFHQLKKEITEDISKLEYEILQEISPIIVDYENILIQKDTKFLRNDHAKWLCQNKGWDIKNLRPEQMEAVKTSVYRATHGHKTPFKLTSNKDLQWLIYTKLGEPVTKKTESGAPSVDGDVIDALAKKHSWAKKLSDKKANEKLLGTYVEGVLRDNINGLVYFDFDQGGTISGRFSTRGGVPIMTLPKGDKRVKKGFVAPPGYKLVVLDYSSLEPHLAAYLSGDPLLIDSFVSGKDFYSVIGIKQFNKTDSTPFKDGTPSSFPVKYGKLRDLCKTYALATLYGAEDYRISEVLHPEAMSWDQRNKARKEAQDLIDGYFKSFPGTKKLIDSSHMEAHLKGEVRTKFGRIRHMPMVHEMYKKYKFQLKDSEFAKRNNLRAERRIYKNFLNNSVNFKVQGLAAHACNRAAINIRNEFRKLGIDGHVAIQVHDELGAVVREDQAELAMKIMDRCMSQSVDIRPIVLKTEGKIANNLAEAK